jgi:hypothetical protein
MNTLLRTHDFKHRDHHHSGSMFSPMTNDRNFQYLSNHNNNEHMSFNRMNVTNTFREMNIQDDSDDDDDEDQTPTVERSLPKYPK